MTKAKAEETEDCMNVPEDNRIPGRDPYVILNHAKKISEGEVRACLEVLGYHIDELAERIAKLTEENARLQAALERCSAPVTDEEQDAYSSAARQNLAVEYGCTDWQELAGDVQQYPPRAVDVLMDLANMEAVRLALAARAAIKEGEVDGKL